MNESAAKAISAGRSQAIDMDDFERRLRSEHPRAPEPDPLAELATLVNSAEDPFRELFAEPRAPGVQPNPPDQGYHQGEADAAALLRSYAEQMRTPQALPPQHDYAAEPGQSVALRGTLPADPASDPMDEFERSVAQLVAARNGQYPAAAEAIAAPVGYQENYYQSPEQPYSDAGYENEYASGQVAPGTGYEGEQAEGYAADRYVPAEAENGHRMAVAAGGAMTGLPVQPAQRPAAPPARLGDAEAPPPPPHVADAAPGARSRKPVYLAGAAMAVMVVGIGATLALRSAPGNGEIPTILASKVQIKVKPEADASAKPVRTVSVLNPQSPAAKSNVVTREEQPIDLAQVPPEPKKALRLKEEELSRKINLGDRNMNQPIASRVPALKEKRAASGYFPEPRKVRTVMVRPDGTLIDPTASIPAVRPARSEAPVPRADSKPERRSERQAERDVRSIPMVPAQQVERTASRPARAAQPRRAETRAAPPPPAQPRPAQPRRSAALDLAPAAQGSRGGAYAVQLAAPASESAARSVASRAKSRYGSVLGGRSPSVQRAVVGSRTVYRVRVIGLSRDAAGRMCSQVKSKGGACFVARN